MVHVLEYRNTKIILALPDGFVTHIDDQGLISINGKPCLQVTIAEHELPYIDDMYVSVARPTHHVMSAHFNDQPMELNHRWQVENRFAVCEVVANFSGWFAVKFWDKGPVYELLRSRPKLGNRVRMRVEHNMLIRAAFALLDTPEGKFLYQPRPIVMALADALSAIHRPHARDALDVLMGMNIPIEGITKVLCKEGYTVEDAAYALRSGGYNAKHTSDKLIYANKPGIDGPTLCETAWG